MQSIAEFLESSPKNYLNQIHSRVSTGGGLVSNSKIIQEVKEWAVDSDRTAKILNELSEDQKRILLYVYASGTNGIELNKLQNSFKKFSKKDIATIIDTLIWNLLIFKRKGAQPVYFGFNDLFDTCFNTLKESEFSFSSEEDKHWADYSCFLPSHYFSTLAYISQNSIKITANGDIHKKYLNNLLARFSYSSIVSETVGNDELDLIINFAYSSRHIMEGELILNVGDQFKKFLTLQPVQQFCAILDWWEELRFKKNRATFKVLLDTITTEPTSLRKACEVWWVFDTNRKKNYCDTTEGFCWEDLPKVIRELWALGLIEFSLAKGKLYSVKRSPLGEAWITSNTDALTSIFNQTHSLCTQDFEILYPVQKFGNVQYILEHISVSTNDDRLLKYTLTKSKVLEGMSHSISATEIAQITDSLNFPGIVANNFTEWISESTNSEICEAYLLKVHSEAKFNELKSFPEFLAHTLETIPGYGFILKHEQEEEVRELLSHFGLSPPTNKIEPKKFVNPLKESVISSSWKLAEPVYYDIDYSMQEPQTKEKGQLKNSAYTAPPKNMDFGQILKNIKYAVLMEEQIEVVWHETEVSRAILNSTPKRNDETRRHCVVSPISLNQNKDPITLHSITVESNEDMYININEIEFIKILED